MAAGTGDGAPQWCGSPVYRRRLAACCYSRVVKEQPNAGMVDVPKESTLELEVGRVATQQRQLKARGTGNAT